MKESCLVVAGLLFVAASTASHEDALLQEWKLYKTQYNKVYVNPEEDYYRMRIFKDSIYIVASHNARFRAGDESFEMEINKFSDMLSKEVDNIYNGFNKENRLRAKEGEVPFLPELNGEPFVMPNITIPQTMNWFSKGAVSKVKDQGNCGSCYAFASVGALEGQLFVKTKKLVPLSVQNVIDCSQEYGNMGCSGGLAMFVYNYIKANNGINDEETYPYEAKDGKCRFNKSRIAAKFDNYIQLPKDDEEALKHAVAMGPVCVSIDSSLRSFQQYKSGVYFDPKCSSTKLRHAVLAVGYGTDSATKKDYWLIKNSWASTWGDKGFVKIARNARNMCGVATRPVYPRV